MNALPWEVYNRKIHSQNMNPKPALLLFSTAEYTLPWRAPMVSATVKPKKAISIEDER